MDLLDFKKFDSAEVGYHKEGDYISLKYTKESTSEDFRALWNYALELKIKYQTNKWLLNKTLENVYPRDIKWLADVWLKKSIELTPISVDNPRYFAFIMPLNFYSEFSTEEFIKANTKDGYIINVLPNTREAYSWLCNVGNMNSY